ncbi:MAG: CPBP family intramembrane glutamic endopeptidase [Acidimicrobiia bacterium]|nr:CPBP family intramembrane glutamic endopeptidase [Acidimicrobiia bacterium]
MAVETPPPTLHRQDLDQRTLVVFGAATVLLVVFEYWGLPGSIRGTGAQDRLADLLGDGYTPYFDLIPYQYWGISSLVVRVLLPLLVIVAILGERPRDWGWRVVTGWEHVRPYALFLGVMVPVVWIASAMGSFQAKYPFYDGAVAGGWHFWGFQLFYGLQFLGVEAFFRGFLLFGLERRFGWYSIAVMVIPYTMIHFGKPMPETFAAIVAGAALGYLALRSRSFLYGAALHWAVAITMDVTVLGRQLGFTETLARIF